MEKSKVWSKRNISTPCKTTNMNHWGVRGPHSPHRTRRADIMHQSPPISTAVVGLGKKYWHLGWSLVITAKKSVWMTTSWQWSHTKTSDHASPQPPQIIHYLPLQAYLQSNVTPHTSRSIQYTCISWVPNFKFHLIYNIYYFHKYYTKRRFSPRVLARGSVQFPCGANSDLELWHIS